MSITYGHVQSKEKIPLGITQTKEEFGGRLLRSFEVNDGWTIAPSSSAWWLHRNSPFKPSCTQHTKGVVLLGP